MTPEKQKERIRKFIFALGRGDTKELGNMVAPNFTFELMTSAPGFPQVMDRSGFLETLPKMLGELLPNGFNYTCDDALADGIHASMQGTCDTLTATGKRYANRYHWYFHFTGDKIDNFREYMDSYMVMQAFQP